VDSPADLARTVLSMVEKNQQEVGS
jgi:hypothetical protein